MTAERSGVEAGRAIIERAAVSGRSAMAEHTASLGDRRDQAGFRLIDRRNRHGLYGGESCQSDEAHRSGGNGCKQGITHAEFLSWFHPRVYRRPGAPLLADRTCQDHERARADRSTVRTITFEYRNPIPPDIRPHNMPGASLLFGC